jgi:hypothetical protein
MKYRNGWSLRQTITPDVAQTSSENAPRSDWPCNRSVSWKTQAAPHERRCARPRRSPFLDPVSAWRRACATKRRPVSGAARNTDSREFAAAAESERERERCASDDGASRRPLDGLLGTFDRLIAACADLQDAGWSDLGDCFTFFMAKAMPTIGRPIRVPHAEISDEAPQRRPGHQPPWGARRSIPLRQVGGGRATDAPQRWTSHHLAHRPEEFVRSPE